MSIIREAFIEKARGGTDEAGIKWDPLTPKYVAYGRRHPGLPPRKTRVASGKKRFLLTKKLDTVWRQIYAHVLNSGLRKGMGQAEASGWAARAAWKRVKAMGGQTILGKYGDTKVEIGRSTDRLFNSLGPESTGVGSEQRVIQPGAGRVRVGTNVVYAGPFHKRRPLWPADNAWPDVWLGRLADVIGDGLATLLAKSV